MPEANKNEKPEKPEQQQAEEPEKSKSQEATKPVRNPKHPKQSKKTSNNSRKNALNNRMEFCLKSRKLPSHVHRPSQCISQGRASLIRFSSVWVSSEVHRILFRSSGRLQVLSGPVCLGAMTWAHARLPRMMKTLDGYFLNKAD